MEKVVNNGFGFAIMVFLGHKDLFVGKVILHCFWL
jgi:hypothetical protein